MCDRCSLGWHLKCAGLKARAHEKLKRWYCPACKPESDGAEGQVEAGREDQVTSGSDGGSENEAECEDEEAVGSGGGAEKSGRVGPGGWLRNESWNYV